MLIQKQQLWHSLNQVFSKLHVVLEEAHATSYWLRLLYAVNLIEDTAFKSIHKACIELQKMLSSIK
ncbi:four helix bundle protein [Pontibacter silvestris]|uniref:Four helix bundle protein n=1 Tax=Pontibacter silvestris TaxID=2305183 RepID=A0ABW4WWR3_9BACT